MRLDSVRISQGDSRILIKSALVALALEFGLLTLMGIEEHWLAHPQKTTGLDSSKFIEAEVFQIPKINHLTEVKTPSAPKHEEVLSKKPDVGKKSQTPPPDDQKNQTDAGANISGTHGPLAIVAPLPLLPPYLQEKDLNASVVIEFLVTNQGTATPRLINSSGDEELDAIALGTVKLWQFKPAEQGHKPIDSKVRLRINFQVH